RHVVQQIVPVGEFGRHGLPPLGPRPAPPSPAVVLPVANCGRQWPTRQGAVTALASLRISAAKPHRKCVGERRRSSCGARQDRRFVYPIVYPIAFFRAIRRQEIFKKSLRHTDKCYRSSIRCPLNPRKRTLELGRQISFCAKMQERSHLPGKWCSFILELPTDIPKLRELKGSDDAFGIPRTRLKACRRRWLLRRCP